MVLHLSWEALAQNPGLQPEVMNSDVMSVQQAFQHRRRGAETRLVTGTGAPPARSCPAAEPCARIAGPTCLRKGESLSHIAKAENCSDSLARSRAALAFLAPDFQRAILDGTASPHLTTNLIVRTTLPHDWQEQAKALGL